jgi:hypothetical protein
VFYRRALGNQPLGRFHLLRLPRPGRKANLLIAGLAKRCFIILMHGPLILKSTAVSSFDRGVPCVSVAHESHSNYRAELLSYNWPIYPPAASSGPRIP